MKASVFGWILLCLIALSLTGCSDGSEYVPVKGMVTYNGTPLQGGVIMFQPPNGPPSRGTIQPDGTYQLKTIGKDAGARVGLNKVRVAMQKPPDNAGEEAGLGKLVTPEKYNNFTTTPLTAEIAEGAKELTFDFDLKD